jgi:hypothetical protein
MRQVCWKSCANLAAVVALLFATTPADAVTTAAQSRGIDPTAPLTGSISSKTGLKSAWDRLRDTEEMRKLLDKAQTAGFLPSDQAPSWRRTSRVRRTKVTVYCFDLAPRRQALGEWFRADYCSASGATGNRFSQECAPSQQSACILAIEDGRHRYIALLIAEATRHDLKAIHDYVAERVNGGTAVARVVVRKIDRWWNCMVADTNLRALGLTTAGKCGGWLIAALVPVARNASLAKFLGCVRDRLQQPFFNASVRCARRWWRA